MLNEYDPMLIQTGSHPADGIARLFCKKMFSFDNK